MTQVIKKCNEVHVGKTYPLQDLRTAESIEQLCEYVDAGHPIAMKYGGSAWLLSKLDDIYYCVHHHKIVGSKIVSDTNIFKSEVMLDRIKLAPLAYSNGRPLHVGDNVVIIKSNSTWVRVDATLSFLEYFQEKEWKFADEMPVWWRA